MLRFLALTYLMETNDKSIQTNDSKEIESKLTSKNRCFLEFLSQGKNTLEAYKLAGYQGDDHAAYELKSKLSKDFEAYLTAKGLSRADLMLAVKKLIDLPIVNDEHKTMKDQMKLLTMWLKMLPTESNNKPSITAFVINNHNAVKGSSTANEAPVQVDIIDVEAQKD